MGSNAGVGAIVGVGDVLLGLDSELVVGDDWLDVELVTTIIVARDTEGEGGEELERHEGLLEKYGEYYTHRSVLENVLVK